MRMKMPNRPGSFFQVFPAAGVLGLVLVYALLIDGSTSTAPFPQGVDTTPDPRIIVAFRNDDLTVYSEPSLENSILRRFSDKGIRQTFAFIPRPELYVNPDSISRPSPLMIDSLNAWRASGIIEVALHGYSHVRVGRFSGEFANVPAGDQSEMIRAGKRIVDSTFGVPVRIFAPPWNQADSKTLEACRDLGLNVFSGYLGVDPVEGIIQVNTNSVLFADGTGLPEAEMVFHKLQGGVGTRYLCVFYHSRVDFPNDSTTRRLERFLEGLASDSLVQFSSIAEIAEVGGLALRQYTAAGTNIIQAEDATDRAKPYLAVVNLLRRLGGNDSEQDRLLTQAYEAYWIGDYSAASSRSRDLMGYADAWRMGMRSVVAGLALAVAFTILWSRSRRVVRRWQIGAAVIFGLTILILNIHPVVSPHRTNELSVLAAILLSVMLFAGETVIARHSGANGVNGHLAEKQ